MPSKLRQFIDGEDMSVILRQEEDLGANDSYRKVPAVNAPLEQGLTAAQVRERKQNGYANVSNEKNTKSVSDIIKSNVFTYFNGVFIVLAILMFSVGAWKNCAFLFVVLTNTLIGIIQELRSKQAVDKLTILAEGKVTAIRDGRKVEVPTSELVRDDIVEFKNGDQICADAVVRAGEIAVNEALLTGESDAIQKTPGENLKSGSSCTSGRCYAQLTRVGSESYASRLTQQAKSNVESAKSEMMLSLDKLIKFIGIALVPIGIALFITQKTKADLTVSESIVSTVSALIGMIPEGLYLLTSVALVLSVMRLSRRKVLVRDMNCVETLARVDTLCVDKTGTITEPGMDVDELVCLNPDRFPEDIVREMLYAYYGTMDADNDTAVAMNAFFRESDVARSYASDRFQPTQVVPFASETKWSAVTFGPSDTFIIGAPEFILKQQAPIVTEYAKPWTSKGMRVLLVAYYNGSVVDASGRPCVDPYRVEPVAFVCILNRIRNQAPETFSYFAEQGVTVKVISGDNPITVSNVAKQANIENAENYVDATTLDTPEKLTDAATRYTVFGRVTPQQKLALVKALKAAGHTVAMTGDGVNDVLALKEADCGIAMASGSQAASQISKLVLLDSDFASMPSIVAEGRQVINNIQRSASLFLVKNIFSFLFAILTLFIAFPYPLLANQMSIISGLTIGIPGFFLALQPNATRIKGRFLPNVLFKAGPGGLTDVLLILGVEFFAFVFRFELPELYSVAPVVMLTVGIVFLYMISRPVDRYRLTIWALMAVASLIMVLVVPYSPLRDWVYMEPMTTRTVLITLVFVALAYPTMWVLMKAFDKARELVETRRAQHTAGKI
ncbi:MAG: cation-translocating P-type ATPase [Clostridia bacterium]|nr:cation-translocating P-type ATPase [Clostridia bacterium]